MRFFNTEGPVRPDDHYAIAPLDRMDVDELLSLIRAKRYFVLHAPRQTGKTSALIALRDLLNSGEVGNFRCVNVNVEVAQVARDDMAEGIRAILSMMASRALLNHSQGEERFLVLGMSSRQRVLVVSHAERPPRTRLISTRSATRHERGHYEDTR